MRVLIVKMSAMGDIIHALPVLDYLHKVSPGIEIDWLVEEPFQDVDNYRPAVKREQLLAAPHPPRLSGCEENR